MDKIEVTQADRTLYHQLLSLGSVNLNRRRMGLPIVDGFELIAAHRLATRTDATPVAWEWRVKGITDWIMQRVYPNPSNDRTDIERRALYAHPPATDVAALVEALEQARTTISITRTNIMCEIGRCADPSESRWEGVPDQLAKCLANIDAALAPFTKGQNDD